MPSPRSSRCPPPTTPITRCRSPSSSTRATACTCATSASAAPTASTTRCCVVRCASPRAAGGRIPPYSDVTQFVSSSSTFSSRTLSFGPTWAYPIAETMYIRAGAAFDSSQLLTNQLSSALQAQQWVQQNGHPYSRLAHDDATNNFEV